MSTQLKVKCIDQTLTLTASPVIASGGLNEDTVTFEFCQKWAGFSKTAIFYRDKKDVYYSLVDGENTCFIPQEVLQEDGALYFGIFGTNDSGVTRTSEILRYKIVEGAITKDIKPSDPTPDIYEQLLAKWQDIKDGEEKFTQDITKQQNDFEASVNNKVQKVTDDEKAFEEKITTQQENYENVLNGQWSTYKTETDKEIAEKLSKVYRPCGSVANYEALPTDAEVGDVYNLLDTGVNWAWTGTEWDSLAGIVDLSDYATKAYVGEQIGAVINADY